MSAHHPPGSYLVTCPYCGERRVEAAKRLWILRGLVLAARYGTKTLLGCSECVRSQAQKELFGNLAGGWWSIPWGIGTPFVVLQNFIEILMPASQRTIEEVLVKGGIAPDDVRVDSRGFTGEQRRMLDAAYSVLGRTILADGRVDSNEVNLAAAIVGKLSGQRISRREIVDALLLADPSNLEYERLSPEYSSALLRMAFDVAISDGVLAAAELRYLRSVADRLGFAPGAVDELLRESRRERRSTRQHRTPPDSKLARALACLEVSDPTDMLAIKSAYRRLMLRYHPDRVATDERKQADYHTKAQEINWAYEYLLEYSEVRSGSGVRT